MMGPEPGTPEYQDQVETIVKAGQRVRDDIDLLRTFILMYVMDTTYSRAAIAEAEKRLRTVEARS